MNYERLPLSYWSSQAQRIEEIRQRIVERGEAVDSGRTVPEDEHLVIGTGRRLQMAVLFLDICGFSSRPSDSQSDQDMLLRALNLFFSEMFRIAEDYGGEVEKNTGDGLMAYFPDGDGHTTGGSQRAVAAALTMFYANQVVISPILRSSGLAPIAFRVGIDHGAITIARIGAARRFNSLAAVGTTANLACKMLRHAGPDEILVGDSVRRRLPADWDRDFCRLKSIDWGWTYAATGAPYPLWSYEGRWTQPRMP